MQYHVNAPAYSLNSFPSYSSSFYTPYHGNSAATTSHAPSLSSSFHSPSTAFPLPAQSYPTLFSAPSTSTAPAPARAYQPIGESGKTASSAHAPLSAVLYPGARLRTRSAPAGSRAPNVNVYMTSTHPTTTTMPQYSPAAFFPSSAGPPMAAPMESPSEPLPQRRHSLSDHRHVEQSTPQASPRISSPVNRLDRLDLPNKPTSVTPTTPVTSHRSPNATAQSQNMSTSSYSAPAHSGVYGSSSRLEPSHPTTPYRPSPNGKLPDDGRRLTDENSQLKEAVIVLRKQMKEVQEEVSKLRHAMISGVRLQSPISSHDGPPVYHIPKSTPSVPSINLKANHPNGAVPFRDDLPPPRRCLTPRSPATTPRQCV